VEVERGFSIASFLFYIDKYILELFLLPSLQRGKSVSHFNQPESWNAGCHAHMKQIYGVS